MPFIKKQIAEFMDHQQEANEKRTMPRLKEDYEYIETFFNTVIRNRNSRADEIDSPEYQEVLKIAKKLLPFPTSLEDCMDGRLFGPLVGLFGHVGESLTVAGGILHEFVRKEIDQKLHLMPDSNFAQLLRKTILQQKSDTVVEILDSHLGCAAREAEENAKGKYPLDKGLLADVISKKEMREAMIKYVENYSESKKHIIPIQVSMDPHSGFLYIGLASDEAIPVGIKHGAYSKEVIAKLVSAELVISTEQMANDPGFLKFFEKYAFKIDLLENYAESALKIYRAVEAMKENLLPAIEEKLKKVYPRFAGKDKIKEKELRQRAILLLINSFIGFCIKKHSLNTHIQSIQKKEFL